jgi:tRNA-dihydrouridine synthase A
MMAWTDRHCRYLLRLTAPRTLLFTEMITANALLHGPTERLLACHPDEHPLAIQLGGSEPGSMAAAARLADRVGFEEINLNVGCPSPRVKRGSFGACLMREPELVAELVEAIRGQVCVPVSVKCRLGVDDHDSQPLLEAFVDRVAEAGCTRFYVHARKALLNGLSPAQNRQIPPLQYDRVYRLKARRPDLSIVLNGGIDDLDDAIAHLARVDGLMIGRRAYHHPLFMNQLAVRLHGAPAISATELLEGYTSYMATELAAGTRLADMTRHCLGLFTGVPGARHYRRILSDHRRLQDNDLDLVHEAVDQLQLAAA